MALGTLVAIEATAGSPGVATAAVDAAFAAIAQVDRRMHPRAADSDLAKINASGLHVPITVHPSVCELLDLAYRINTLTSGVFDPCLPGQPGRLQDVEVSTDSVVCHAPVALDFGGFAKGYAVDCAIEALMHSGCVGGLVNAGGDLRVFGVPTEPTFLRGHAGELTNVDLTDAALAVSDTDMHKRQRPAEHQGYYIRGRIETPSIHFAAVVANEAVIADALAKCVLLCPKPIADRALRAFGATRATSAPVTSAKTAQ